MGFSDYKSTRPSNSRAPKFGKREFGGGSKKYGDRPAGKAFMHDATCSKCGKACQLPFRPDGQRAVFCSNCFSENGNAGKPAGAPSFSRSNAHADDSEMFEATCYKCGSKCQVPFRPISGKPVFCKVCFDKSGNPATKVVDQYKDQFEKLNAKLDKILKALSSPTVSTEKGAETAVPAEEATEAKPAKKAKKALGKKK